jgi:hypothetical protein
MSSPLTRWVVAAAVVLLVGGCSGQGGQAQSPPVASLASAAAPAGKGTAGDERPVLPLEENADDFEAAAQPWIRCLVAEGGPAYQEQWKLYARGDINRSHPGKGRKGLYDKCLSKMPETFEAHQRRTDPVTYRENQREWYQCAKAAGYQLTTPDPETGEFGLTAVGPQGDFGSPANQACRRQAFTD